MKRLATLAALTLALLVASLARADWHQGSGLNGGPLDFWIADAGYFSVHTNGNAAYRMVDNGTSVVTVGSVSVNNNTAKCTAIVNDKVKVGGFNSYYDEANPGSSTPVPPQTDIQGCRVTENFAGYGYGDLVGPGAPSMFADDAGTFPAPMNPVPVGDTQSAFNTAISAHTLFGRDYAFVPRPASFGIAGFFAVDGAPISPYLSQSMGGVQRSEIFGTRDGGVRAIQVGTDGGQLLTLAAPNPVALQGFGLPAALIPNPYRIRGVSLSELEGGPNGAGFGMLVVESATPGTPNVWRAIPDPSHVGEHWVPSTVPPPAPGTGSYDSVRCIGGRFCALGSSASTNSGQPQVATYVNAASPTVVPPAFVVQEGAPGVQSMTANASDLDGDAVFVTWTLDPSWTMYFTSVDPDPTVHDGRTRLGTTIRPNGNLCGLVQASVPVTVSANDGLNQGPSANGTITVVHTPPGQPGTDQTTFIQAGSPAVTQSYTFASNGCSNLGTEIVPSTPATAMLTSSTTLDVRFTPPRVFCDDTPDAGARQFQVKVVDGAVKSPAATATFVVLPWGEPEPPFGAGRTVSQDAGTAVTYRPDATHLCEGDAGTFPGVDTRWTWTSTGSGFTPVVLQADAGLLPQSGAVTPTATVVALDCQSGTVTFQATNTTRIAGGLSASSPLTVNVTSTLQALSGTLTVTAIPDGGSVNGVVDLNPVQCPQNRPDLETSVALIRASDAGLISSATVPGGVPAAYSLRAPGACAGGAFYVRASVGDSTGSVGPVDQPVNLQVLDPGFSSVTVDPFTITCGDVARGHASVTFGQTDCDSAEVDWSSAGAVAIAPGVVGTSVDLTTVSSDFNALIGLPVEVVATSVAESGTKSVPAAPSVVTVDPFVLVVHRTDTAVASESRVLGVEVQLKNQTQCGVTDVELHESLEGVQLIRESIIGPDGGRIDPVDGDAGEFVVPGLSLPGDQVVTVRYSVRPNLFGDVRPGGQAMLRGVPISKWSSLTPGSTCGCQSASGGVTALIGLVGVALLRRRRRG